MHLIKCVYRVISVGMIEQDLLKILSSIKVPRTLAKIIGLNFFKTLEINQMHETI